MTSVMNAIASSSLNANSETRTPMMASVSDPRPRFYGRHFNAFNSGTRIIRSLTLENRDFLPRPFQIELYEACKNRDTIVFLRPGQGKYFISVMLVKYFSPHKLPSSVLGNTLPFQVDRKDRKIFFLTKSLNSIKLYSSVFGAHSDLYIGEYLNTEQAKQWSKEQWKQQLQTFDIHLMLDELFEYLLDRDLVNENDINLLILDDVHKILLQPNKTDCYTKIVRKLKSNKNFDNSDPANNKHYRILGLSASILLEDVSSKIFERMIKQIESDLGCSCETYADLRMINKYSIQSRIKFLVYPSLMATRTIILDEKQYRFSLFLIRNYAAQFFEFILNFSSKGANSDHIIDNESIAKITIDILEVYGQLGEWCALKLIEMVNRELFDTITLLNKTESNYLRLLNVAHTTLRLIRQSILNYLQPDIAMKIEQSARLNLEQFLSLSSPKLHLLAHVLHDYLTELNRPPLITGQNTPHSTFTFPANICALIYAENRSTARVLDEWLKELAMIASVQSKESTNSMINCFSYLLPDHVFLAEDDGKNEMKNFYYRKHQKSLHEIYYYRKQEETLKKFRLAHNCNVLITTSMSAEGLDVNRCNMVVCFDPVKTFHQFIQSKGRVRVEKGQFVVMVAQPNHQVYLHKFLEFVNIEKIFTKLVPLNNQVTIEKEPNIHKFVQTSSTKLEPRSNEIRETKEPSAAVLEENHPSCSEPAAQESQQKPLPTTVSNQQRKDKSSVGISSGEKFTSTIPLTLDNAIPLLNRYCNKLPSDTFTKLVPNFKIESIDENGDLPKFRCRLYLPINSTYRDEIVGEPKTTQSLAKQSAAYQAVKTLREIGELDHNYYPIGKETSRYIEKLGLQDCFINTNKMNTATGNATTASATNTTAHNQHQRHPNGVSPYPHPQKGNRYNRIQNRNIASKRRQYYDKKVAESLRGQVFKQDPKTNRYYYQYLYQFDMKLTYRLPEEQNSRGRRIIDPAETSRMFGIISPNYLPPICDFTIYNRSGEVTVSLQPIFISNSGYGCQITEEQIRAIENFHQYTFENVLPLGKSSIHFDQQNASNGNYLIVPIDVTRSNDNVEKDGDDLKKSIDWNFIQRIWDHSRDQKSYDENIFRYDNQQCFIFEENLYQDAVVIPKYRKDKLQAFYYVAEICKDLTPLSPFPDEDFKSFEEYYRLKYSKQITNLQQPLLDVDHTSARLNLLTPRFLNRKGLPIPTLKAKQQHHSHHSKRSPQQKQILVPELCYIHPFPASFWRKAVGLPCILYRLNLLLIAEELRLKIAKEANIGVTDLPVGEKWSKLDFGWSALVERARQQQLEQEMDSLKLSDIVIENLAQPLPSSTPSSEASDNASAKDVTVETVLEKDTTSVNDPFSLMDDWSSFSITIPEPDKNLNFDDNGLFMPQIDIISGPFSDGNLHLPIINGEEYPSDFEEKEEEEEMSSIVEVDDQGNPIQAKSNKSRLNCGLASYQPVRAGSPTYWQNVAENEEKIEVENKIADIDWTVWEPTVSVDEKFSLNLDELKKEISELVTKPLDGYDKVIDDDYDDFNLGEDLTNTKTTTKSSSKKKKNQSKPMITSLSDLDDDDDEDGDGATYSDFDLDDSSEDDDEDDVNFGEDDETDDEFTDDDDEDYADYDLMMRGDSGKNKKNKNGPNLSQTMNAYQMKSVIYDVLEIELLYDPKQIEQKLLKNYYRQRFALADQEPEHLRKRKLFDEMYRKEKQQVLECVRNICEQLKSCDGPQNDEGMSAEIIAHLEKEQHNNDDAYYPEEDPILFDKHEDEIDLSETLFEVLMKKIDHNLVESLRLVRNIDPPSNNGCDGENGNHCEEPLPSSPSTSLDKDNVVTQQSDSEIPEKKMEVKFGELLPNRNDHCYCNNNQCDNLEKHQEQAKFINLERQKAIKDLPKWLQTDNSTSDDNHDFSGVSKLGPHPNLILQAITMSNSSDGINLERLETVGDSFLKYSITAFLFCMCPELNEGKLSFLRSRQISNINLHRLGQQINLGQLMIASKFEPVDNWCPPSYQVVENVEPQPISGAGGDNHSNDKSSNNNGNKVPYNLLTQHSIPNKSLADCVEALIGTYLISSGSQGAIQFMDWLGLKVLPKKMKIITKEINDNNLTKEEKPSMVGELNREKWLPQPRSPLIIPKHLRNNSVKVREIEDKLQETYYKHHLDRFEEIIGYQFKDRAYLVQAFTHNSYYENTVTDCYQRLEFLGDAVLDYLITRYLYEDSRCHSPGTLTDLRSALVNNTFFAALAVKYSFHKYLMMLSSELYRVIDGFVRKFNIHYSNNNGTKPLTMAIRDSNDPDVLEKYSLSNGYDEYNYWELFISENEAEHLEDIEVPKALGDIFESVAGAIYLDSGMSLEAVWKAYYPMMKPEIENFSDKVPKSPIRVLLENQPQSVKFGKPEINSGRRIRVTAEVFGLGKFVGIGRNKRIAKCTAAKRALRALESEKRRSELLEQQRLKRQQEC